jgi:hypothetical protein
LLSRAVGVASKPTHALPAKPTIDYARVLEDEDEFDDDFGEPLS